MTYKQEVLDELSKSGLEVIGCTVRFADTEFDLTAFSDDMSMYRDVMSAKDAAKQLIGMMVYRHQSLDTEIVQR